MDSGLSHDPAELGALLEAARDRFDLVVGSRYVPGGSVTNWSRLRLALSRMGNTYARLMLGVPLKDATSGFRAYRRALLQDLVAEPFHADGYGFQVELVMRAWLGWTIGEVPITFREREHGHSKLSRRSCSRPVARDSLGCRAQGHRKALPDTTPAPRDP